MFRIEIKVGGTWVPARAPPAEPFNFKTEAEARTIVRVLFTDLLRLGDETGEEVVRVTQKES